MHGSSTSSHSSAADQPITVAQALTYLHQGWSVIPVVFQAEADGKISKRPAIKWRLYQQRLPTEAEISLWFGQGRYHGIGAVTGRISGIVVVDIEQEATPEDVQGIESPLESRTLHGGRHLFYRWTTPIANAVRIGAKPIDLRGDGGFVVLPPSQCSRGSYSWSKQAKVDTLLPLPDSILEMLSSTTTRVATVVTSPATIVSQKKNALFQSAMQGQRNMMATQIAGILCANISKKLWKPVAWPRLVQWNETQCQPPLAQRELHDVWQSISTKHQHRHEMDKNLKALKSTVIQPWQQFSTQQFKEPEWIVDQLIPKHGLIAVAGPPESGKSYFTAYLAITIANGRKLFDQFTTERTAVLIVDQENLPAWIQHRLIRLGATAHLPLHIYASRDCPFNLEDKAALKQVAQYIDTHQIGLLILDTLRLSHNRDENSSTDMKPVFDRLKVLAQKTAVLFIQHHRKVDNRQRHRIHGEDMMGSMLIRGSVDYQLSLVKMADVANSATQIRVTQTKARYTKNLPPFTIMLEESDGKLQFNYHQGSLSAGTKVDQAKTILVKLLSQGDYDRQELLDAVVAQNSCGVRTVEAALADLNKEGTVAHSESKPRRYFLADSAKTISHACGNIQLQPAECNHEVREKKAQKQPKPITRSLTTTASAPQDPVPQTAGIYKGVRNAKSPGTPREKELLQGATKSFTKSPASQSSRESQYQTEQDLAKHLNSSQLQQNITQVKQWLLQHERQSTAEPPLAVNNKPYTFHRWQRKLLQYCGLIDAAQSRNTVRNDDWLEMARLVFHTDDGIAGKWIS